MLDQYAAPVFFIPPRFHSTQLFGYQDEDAGKPSSLFSFWRVLKELDVSCLDVTRCDRGEVPLQKSLRSLCFDEGEGTCIPPEIVKAPGNPSQHGQ